ncbi:MAG: hypothetical protein J3K34DRAFT_135846 [Monoraphidium minutum]|nr:MAG: hypothetical protein J3K34DRAFT_135846 [Monoraphidium minutum]
MAEQRDGAAPANKLAEQATAKADLSYSYWTANAAKAGVSTVNPAPSPKKLTDEEARALQQRAASGGAAGTSASTWNAAGTFEEKDATEWAKGALKAALAGAAGGGAGGPRVTGVSSVAGHANIWFIRGSKRAGFEFDIEAAWAVGAGDSEVKGTLKLAGASPDDLDDIEPSEVVVSDKVPGREAAEAAAARAARSELAGPLRAALAGFYSELKQR